MNHRSWCGEPLPGAGGALEFAGGGIGNGTGTGMLVLSPGVSFAGAGAGTGAGGLNCIRLKMIS